MNMNFREAYKKDNAELKPSPEFMEKMGTYLERFQAFDKERRRINRIGITLTAAAAFAFLVVLTIIINTDPTNMGVTEQGIQAPANEENAAENDYEIAEDRDGGGDYFSNAEAADFAANGDGYFVTGPDGSLYIPGGLGEVQDEYEYEDAHAQDDEVYEEEDDGEFGGDSAERDAVKNNAGDSDLTPAPSNNVTTSGEDNAAVNPFSGHPIAEALYELIIEIFRTVLTNE